MTSAYEYPSLLGQTLFDVEGTSLGTVDAVYVDEGGQPRWASVFTGWLGRSGHVVPLDGVTSTGDGFKAVCTKEQVERSPDVQAADGRLAPEDEQLLARHYGTDAPSPAPSGEPAAGGEPEAEQATTPATPTAAAEGTAEVAEQARDAVENSDVSAEARVVADRSGNGPVEQHEAHQQDGVPHPVDQA